MTRTLGVFLALILLLLVGGLYIFTRPANQADEPPARAPAPVSAPAPAAAPATPDVAGITPPPAPESTPPAVDATFEARDSTFTVDGQRVVLKNGTSTTPSAPGSASLVTTRYLGKEVRGDLNNDGQEDAAFAVTRETGGSGVFFYVVAAIKTKDGYKTTNAFLVGDRIALQSLAITPSAGELRVNYAKRQPGEAMTTPPTADAVLLLKVTPQGVLQGLMK